MKTIVGLYDNRSDARDAVSELINAGYSRDDISLLATDSTGSTTDAPSATMTSGETEADIPADDVVAGAVAGGAIGGLAGVMLGLGALAIPGLGPVIAAGPILAGLTGAGVGAAVGGLIGALVNWGVPREEAELYAEGIRRGSTLVAARVDDDRVNEAVQIMNRFNPIDVSRRSETWRAEGWTGYDTTAGDWRASDATPTSTTAGMGTSTSGDYSQYEPTFREHFTRTYGTTGRDYSDFDPAYRYGYGLADNDQFRNATDWDAIEADAQRGWSNVDYGRNRSWNDYRDAVRLGWMTRQRPTFERGMSAERDAGMRDNIGTPSFAMGMTAETRSSDPTDATVPTTPRDAGLAGTGTGGATFERGMSAAASGAPVDAGYSAWEPTFRDMYTSSYGTTGRDYNYYAPAYQYGYRLATDENYRRYNTWDEMEADARRGWSGEGAWEDFKDTVRGAWERVKQSVGADDETEATRGSNFGAGTVGTAAGVTSYAMGSMPTDYSMGRDPGVTYAGTASTTDDWNTYDSYYREHYTDTYGNRGRDYNFYAPAYRYGYQMAHDDRYANYDSWDQVEADARSGWEKTKDAAQGTWEDFKDAVRSGWEGVREALDMDADYAEFQPYYREHYTETFSTRGHDYDYYDPAYRYGFDLAIDDRYSDYDTWEDLETEARRGWENAGDTTRGAWEDFKDAVRRGWEEVRDAFDMESDYGEFEPSFREHYTTTYGSTGHDYDYYDPAYRYGYILAMDDRYSDFDTWDELESEAQRGWASTEYAGQGAWEDFKDAVRRGWEEVKDAFDADEDYYEYEPTFRQDYTTRYSNSGHDYDYYDPAYRYGYTLANDARYSGYRTWDELESDARRGWMETEYGTQGAWEDFKDAVRRGWEQVKESLDMDDSSDISYGSDYGRTPRP